MRYAQIRSLDISNGNGLGIALFVQGCHFHCKDCFNPETWDFNGGNEWNIKTEYEFLQLANKEHIKRISILGGEPLADENVEDILNLVRKIKYNYPDKKIWLYTGYCFEEILQDKSTPTAFYRFEVLKSVDILCDGRFVTELKDPLNKEVKWVGSTNQRVLDMDKSLRLMRPCRYKGENNGR